jgi:putative ABC transport system permease protein
LRRTVLTGLDPDGRLRRLVSGSKEVVPIPPFGAVLTSDLARRLRVRRGEVVLLEALEDNRRKATVPVVGLVDEMLGSGVYMSAKEVDRFMGSDASASGAYVAVAPGPSGDTYARLQRLPAAAGVAIRALALASLEHLMSQSFGVMTTALVMAAVVVAFGMVYNGARVALAERSHEFASMRVLGFSAREVGIILLGEQAAVTAIAIPVGWALGLGLAALIARLSATEVFRMRVVATASTAVWSCVVVGLAALVSGVIVQRRIRDLDLIGVLKAPE